MPLPSFLDWPVLGTGLWTALLAGAGICFKADELVADYLNPVSTIVVVLIIAWYFYRVVTFEKSDQEPSPDRSGPSG